MIKIVAENVKTRGVSLSNEGKSLFWGSWNDTNTTCGIRVDVIWIHMFVIRIQAKACLIFWFRKYWTYFSFKRKVTFKSVKYWIAYILSLYSLHYKLIIRVCFYIVVGNPITCDIFTHHCISLSLIIIVLNILTYVWLSNRVVFLSRRIGYMKKNGAHAELSGCTPLCI